MTVMVIMATAFHGAKALQDAPLVPDNEYEGPSSTA